MILPFDEAGLGRPIVLLHARPADRTIWRAHLRLLAEAGVRAIAPDLPGHGDAATAQRNQLVARVPYGEPKVAADPLSEDRRALRALAVPALVGVGELDMPDFFEGGAGLSDELGAGEVVVVPDAGHLAPLSSPKPSALCCSTS